MQVFCTIVDTNYIPQARALIESVHKFHSNSKFFLLVFDSNYDFFPQSEYVYSLSIDDLNLAEIRLTNMSTYYDRVEFATSLKPSLIKKLLLDGHQRVTFLDPDILLYSPLVEIDNLIDEHQIVLTPHRLTPLPSSISFYKDETFLQYGTFNLGFISVPKSAVDALDWWEEKLEFQSTRLLGDHIFTDQKWVNLFPAYFECNILKHFGYNLAPWNLDERTLSIQNDNLYAGDSPLRFIHFSQMSGALADGIIPPLWEKTLPSGNIESFKIIESITKNYSDSLVSFRNEQNSKCILTVPESVKLNAWQRFFMRKFSRNESARTMRTLIFLMKIFGESKLINNSETLHALARTLPRDYRRFRSRKTRKFSRSD